MISAKVKIINPSGLHLRPAGNLCNTAVRYKCRISFDYDGGNANAKSVLSVLGACVKCGEEITLHCDGEDEEEALKAMVEAIEGGLRDAEADQQ
jgi:phosphocarrier protein HPr